MPDVFPFKLIYALGPINLHVMLDPFPISAKMQGKINCFHKPIQIKKNDKNRSSERPKPGNQNHADKSRPSGKSRKYLEQTENCPIFAGKFESMPDMQIGIIAHNFRKWI